jgi:glycerol-3-phosphate dehydrogenase
MVIRAETSVLFIIPWGRHWLLGTTDTEWDLDLAHPAASRADIDYVLDHANQVLTQRLEPADVEGVYAGLRPLLVGESAETSKLSREHAVSQPVPGLTTVAGGKYTTYRVMARDAVDSAARGLGGGVAPSATHLVPLAGADGYHALWNRRERLADDAGLHVARIEHLLQRYGSLAVELLQMIDKHPELGRPLAAADDYLAAEAVYAVTHEGAMHLDDVLTRRTHISIETFDRGREAAEQVAALMADTLDWDAETVEREVAHYRARVAAERESQEQVDDATADAARLGAPDVRTLGAEA